MEKKYMDYMVDTLQEIMAIDSPSGYCATIARHLSDKVAKMGYSTNISPKQCLEVDVFSGDNDGKRIGVAAHMDTLGAMIRSISGDGKIRFITVGMPTLPTLDGEYCRIITREGKVFTGTFLCLSPSSHVFPDAGTQARNSDTMYIRLDENISSGEDVKKLGISAGDYIAIDTKTTVTDAGYIKSRFLDDKASVAILLTALKIIKDEKWQLNKNIRFVFTSYEEVGHGGSPYGKCFDEVLALDMGCIGLDLTCTERDVSICALDSTGPYDYELTTRLINIAKEKNLKYAVDIYPRYGSDIGTMRTAGGNLKGALIGAGIHASHGMERTHMDGLQNTLELLLEYLKA